MTSSSVSTNSDGNQFPMPPRVVNCPSVIFFSTFHVLTLLAPWFFSWSALGVALFLFGSIGICLGYHPLLTHRNLQVSNGLEYAIALIGALAL